MDVTKINGCFDNERFWKAFKIYYQHPKSINKEVLFSEDVFIAEFQSPVILSEFQAMFSNFCSNWTGECPVGGSIKNLLLSQYKIIEIDDVESVFLLPKTYLCVRKLIPKLIVRGEIEFFEFIFINKANAAVSIFTKHVQKISNKAVKSKKQDPFAVLKYNFLQLTCKSNCLEIFYDKNLEVKGITWLQTTFVSKFKKLLLNIEMCKIKNNNPKSLLFESKVDIVQYYKFYEIMKRKYAKFFVDNWKENTDPKKFVYEDIGIATYLLMLWNGGNIPEENSKKQKFWDLGCGNGLLVHILNSEGHLGVGLDLRKRMIWDIYPPSTVLEEEVVIPTWETTYSEADWLIGNHSDELTAWIPIMARLSNRCCQYFVLPCCPYQLNGMKFQRKNSSFSSYQDFIYYVKQISEQCEFETHLDKLRIPSTKRICLLGFNSQIIPEEKYILLKDKLIKFIEEECQPFGSTECNNKKSENQISLNVKLRESVERVRNCTKLPQELVNNVLKNIMNELLCERVTCTITKGGKPLTWNRGRKLPIGELASSLNKNLLRSLKSECKGLQTLLKNHHFIFEVGQGFVQFRSPESMLKLCNKYLESQSEVKWKIKQCWFFHNHPDKCPLDDEVCSYRHDKNNIQI